MPDLDFSARSLGDFIVHERIGAGGYGTVWRCEQPALKRAAVIKVLRARVGGNDTTHERFLREAQLASRLDHPYAAHVYSFGVEDDGLLWIAMELVPGVTLGEWLRARGPMSLEAFVPFFERVAQVVAAAHERGIVHRDLKPSNIMVVESGGHLFPKLLDFGIAKLHGDPSTTDADAGADHAAHDAVPTLPMRLTPLPRDPRTRTDDTASPAHLTRPGAMIGSAPYMSPEQWGAPYAVGPATDIYSLGCVAYEALTGRPPFLATKTSEYYEQHLRAEPPPLGDSFPSSLDIILRRALAKSPEARHTSALALAEALSAALRAQPREQLRSSAQQWHDRARPRGLLWGSDVLAEIEPWMRSDAAHDLSELECSFVAASQRLARCIAWARRSLVVLAALTTLTVIHYRSVMQSRLAEEQSRLASQQSRAAHDIAEARTTESELEQGRAALLHGEPEAQSHLTKAYKRDPAPATAFMLARAMQPRLAERARFPSTHGRMWWATFSPDGAQIATTDDRAAQIWDGKTYQLRFTLPHGCEVYQAAYTPDGTRLITAAETMVRVWDTATGALLHDLKPRPGRTPADYYRLALSPDGNLVAAMDAAGAATQVWNTHTGAWLAELHNQLGGYSRLAFSAHGWLATTGGEEVQVFDVRNWARVLTIPGPIRSLAFNTQNWLVTGGATGEVSLWSIPSGTRLRQLRDLGEAVEAVAFSPDDQLVAAGSRDGAIQTWDPRSGALRSQLNPRHSKILALDFDPSSALILSVNADGTVVVADTAQGLPITILDGPRNIVRTAQFDASSRVVGASWDGTARVWDATASYRRWSSGPMSDDCETVMMAEPARRFMAVGCGIRPTRVWDTSRDRLLAELPSVTRVTSGGFTSAFPAVSSGGDLAAIARHNTVEIYTLPGGHLLRTIEHSAAVSAVAFAETGRAMVSGAIDGSVLVTRDDGTELALQAAGGIDVALLLPDGRIVISDAERRLRIYSPAGALRGDLEMPVRMMSIRRAGMRLILLPSYLGNAAPPLLIDVEQARIIAQLEGHVGFVFSARWLPGARIITAGADGTARLWDGSTGRHVRTYRGGARFLADATLTSDHVVIAGDADGILRFWDAESGARLWTLSAHRAAVIGIRLEGSDILTSGSSGEVSRWRLPIPATTIDACKHHRRCDTVSQ
ncbi:MAG: protein kinase [Myxococcales bacterium]|nr:protein kinase [Myxococcales bacterium]